MQKIFLKLFLATIPILLILLIYICRDPFKVLYHYNSFLPKDGTQNIQLNMDYVSTETFLNNYNEYKYDSYIFGNSRSLNYHVSDWQTHINSKNCYHFEANAESLYGIERKFQFLNKKGIKIKNALLIIDQSTCKIVENSGSANIFKKHPLLSGQSNFDFQLECLKSFFDINFIVAYVKTVRHNKLYDESRQYDASINEISLPKQEAQIANNRDAFYKPRMKVFKKRDSIQKYSPQTIKEEQLKLFKNIKKILDADSTIYRIVINPLYDQNKFDTTDLKALYNIYGKNNVYDYSGINEITNDIYNYYENSHYRPIVAKKIMDSIYNNK